MTSAPHQRQLSILIEGASFGITITAGAPTMRAPAATAWPWLPDEKATKPLFRFSSGVDRILFNAPRILNEPVFCSGSAFTSTLAPASSSSIAEARSGVRTMRPARRSAARRMEAISIGVMAPS